MARKTDKLAEQSAHGARRAGMRLAPLVGGGLVAPHRLPPPCGRVSTDASAPGRDLAEARQRNDRDAPRARRQGDRHPRPDGEPQLPPAGAWREQGRPASPSSDAGAGRCTSRRDLPVPLRRASDHDAQDLQGRLGQLEDSTALRRSASRRARPSAARGSRTAGPARGRCSRRPCATGAAGSRGASGRRRARSPRPRGTTRPDRPSSSKRYGLAAAFVPGT